MFVKFQKSGVSACHMVFEAPRCWELLFQCGALGDNFITREDLKDGVINVEIDHRHGEFFCSA
jgi:hypothetical protein